MTSAAHSTAPATMSCGSNSASRKPISGSEDHQVEQVHRTPPAMPIATITSTRAEHHPGGVASDIAGLQQSQHAADVAGARADAVDDAVDQAGIHARQSTTREPCTSGLTTVAS